MLNNARNFIVNKLIVNILPAGATQNNYYLFPSDLLLIIILFIILLQAVTGALKTCQA